MTQASISIPVREITRGMVMHVRMPTQFTVRMRIAAWLMGLAGRVATMPVEIEIAERGGCGGRSPAMPRVDGPAPKKK